MSSVAPPPVFSEPARWVLRVLSWIAFAVAAYLAWHSVSATPVAGCGVGETTGCDIVLKSGWSKWLGMPVAVAGLACYASLAALSVMLGVKDPRLSRPVTTAFLLLAVLAALSSIWFILLQVFAIGDYCRFCLVADTCGILIGGLAVWQATRWWLHNRHTSERSPNLAALRSALPVASPAGPASRPAPRGPSLTMAYSGALVILLLLIGGQLMFPTQTFEVEKVALDNALDMDESPPRAPDERLLGESAESRVAMRLPTEERDSEPTVPFSDEPVTEEPVQPLPASSTEGDSTDLQASDSPDGFAAPASSGNELAGNASEEAGDTLPPDTTPSAESESLGDAGEAVAEEDLRRSTGERIVTLLGGKLSFDVYKHPVLGDPEAPKIVVEMVSYDCKHCRNMHDTIKRAKSRYGDQVAVVVMVVPLEMKCNKLITNSAASHPGACATARMALGVAHLRPAAFPRFHDWLMEDKDKPPAVDRVVGHAYSLVNSERLREFSQSEEARSQIEQYVNLFASLSKQHRGQKQFGLPVQILGDHVMSGTVDKASDVYRAWEEHLGLKPSWQN